MSSWNRQQCVPEQDPVPDWALKQLGELIEKHQQSRSLVEIALGFDLWFLPKDMVLGMFESLRQKGMRLVTAHVGHNAFMGDCPLPHIDILADILDRSPVSYPAVAFLQALAKPVRAVGHIA